MGSSPSTCRSALLTAGVSRPQLRDHLGRHSGRAPHIHAQVHVGGQVSHNGQIFFPESLSTKVYRTSPYTNDANKRTYRKGDRVYTEQHGAASVLAITGGSVATALRGTIMMAVDRDA